MKLSKILCKQQQQKNILIQELYVVIDIVRKGLVSLFTPLFLPLDLNKFSTRLGWIFD